MTQEARPDDALHGDVQAELDAASRQLAEQFGRRFAKGEMIFREGEPANVTFLLQQGRVRLLKRVRMVERSLSILQPGDVFGESALIPGATRMSTAVSLSEGLMLALDRAAVRTVLERYPLLAERILGQLVRRLRDAEDQIEVLMLRDTQSKIVSALLKMAKSGSGGVELALSPVELSSRVGLDVETVKRTVQRLRDQQYLRIVGERVEIPDIDALRRLYALLGTTDELRGER